MNIDNVHTFEVTAKNQSDKNVYVEKVELNGEVLTRPFVTHDAIMTGGNLIFYISDTPNLN